MNRRKDKWRALITHKFANIQWSNPLPMNKRPPKFQEVQEIANPPKVL
jgi:hypothetical protein